MTALLALAAGGAALAGWAFELPVLVRGWNALEPMTPDAATAFGLGGLALWLMRGGARSLSWSARAVVLLCLAGTALLAGRSFVTHRIGGHEGFHFLTRMGDVPKPAMDPLEASCLMVAVIGCLLLTRRTGTRLATSVAAGIGILLGVIGVLATAGDLVDVALGERWWGLHGLALGSAIACAALGAGMAALVGREQNWLWTLERATALCFLAGVVTLIGVAAIVYHALNSFAATMERMARAQRVQIEAGNFEHSMLEASAARRGFLDTRHEEYREDFRAAARQARKHLRTLVELTADNPAQHARAQEIAALIGGTLARIGTGARIEAQPAMPAQSGSAGLLALLSSINAEEQKLLQERQAAAQREFSRAILIVPAGMLGSVFFLATALFILNREAGERLRSVQALRNTEQSLRDSEQRYRLLFESNPMPMWVYDRETLQFLAVNAAAVAAYGYSVDEFRAMSIRDIRPPEDLPMLEHDLAAVARAGGYRTPDLWRHRKKDGTVVTVEIASHDLTLGGRPGRIVLANDVTTRLRAEQSLRESEERFRLIAETIGEVFWMADVALQKTVYVSPAYARIWGRSLASLHENPRSFIEAIHPEDRARVLDDLGSQREGRAFAHEYRILQPSGELRWVWDRGFPVRDTRGAVTHYVGVAEDITDRKRTEEELQRTKNQFQSIFDNAIEGIYQSTPEGTYRAVNPALATMFGFASPAEMIASRRDIAHAGYADPAQREVFKRRIEQDGVIMGFEYVALRKDGSSVWVSENARVVRGAAGGLFYEGSVQDITERRQFEQRLKLQHDVTAILAEAGSLEQIYQRLLATMGAGLGSDWGELWIVDRAARVLRCTEIWHPPSTEFREFAEASRGVTFARGEGLPGRVWESGSPEWSADIAHDERCARRGIASRLQLRSWKGFPIMLRSELLGVVGFFSAEVRARDEEKLATLRAIGTQLGQFMERQQLSEQFRLAQKMEAIGTLAGGIAHDFNNIIAGISGYAELAKMEFNDDPKIGVYLDPVLKGARRAAALVRQILTFSRQQEQRRVPLKLPSIVQEALALLRATIPATIEFDVTIETDLPRVLADSTQLHQVIMNLCTNAAHAMRDRAGVLGVKLERCAVDAAMVATQPGLRAGRYVRLSISDTGHGMDAVTVSRIFEPFFTTKAPGEGTGLGLAVVHGIVQSHDGVITVYSQPGAGTVFRVYLPATDDAKPEIAANLAALPHGAGQRILYVDDEELLAWMGRQVLEKLGYAVESFTDPETAFAVYAAEPARFDLVVTDLAMPKMAGTELARRLLAVNPALPIILVTGFATTHTTISLRAQGIREMALKPLSVHALATTVHRALNEPQKE